MRKLEHAEIVRPSLEELSRLERFPIYVILDDIRSAHNVGSILRTADAVRAQHVYLCGVTPDGTHRGVHKSALGAQDAVPWSHHARASEVAVKLGAEGVRLIALEHTDSPENIESIRPEQFPVALMLGNEVDGLSEDLVRLSDCALEIPQYGIKQSLNVSVAAGVALFGLLTRFLNADSA
jgi:tRNA G18 (ribose-2'-O)-methylase SpoU